MELKIEKMIYGGDGLARVPVNGGARSRTIFVPFVLAGEQVAAAVTQEKPGFSRAEAGRIIHSSPSRTLPGCPYFYRCGGCHYQHSSYENQLVIKRDILLETLRRMARLEWTGEIRVHASPPWNYRNRSRLHAQAKPFALGYFRRESRDLLAVEECPISSPLINRAIAEMWKLGRAGYVPATTREIEFFVDAEDSALLVEVYSGYEPEADEQAALERLIQALQQVLPETQGAVLFATGSSLFPWDTPTWSTGRTALHYQTRYGEYQVQGGAFFQVNRFLVDKLIEVVTDGEARGLAIDLYAGVGLFSVAIAKKFEKVVAVEISPPSFTDLAANVPGNVQAHRLTTEEFLRRFAKTLKPELVIVDPPRSGLELKVNTALIKMAPQRITYVSCDPATLARDLRPIIDGGYRITQIHLFDMFPQTYHLETVVKLELR